MVEFLPVIEGDKDMSLSESNKKVYSTPVIRVYGDLRAVTQATSMNPAHHNDNGMGNTKT